MIIIVGLGNTGEKYKKTRHNIGFRIVDEFAKENSFPQFKLLKKFQSLISDTIFDGKKIILAKPQTFVNNSGKALKPLINFYKIARTGLAMLIVIHDDIDLLLGKIKIVKNRGSAGHKGVESIISEIGNKNFIRFRIGIKPTEQSVAPVRRTVEKFVLEKFSKEEEIIIKEVIKKSSGAIEFLIANGLEKTMTEFNK